MHRDTGKYLVACDSFSYGRAAEMAAYRYLAVSALATVWAWGLACGAWKTEVATSAKQDSFLYVYDVPDMFTQRIVDMPLDRDKAPWSLWYDQDQVCCSMHSSIAQ